MGYRTFTASYLFEDADGNTARLQTSVPTSAFSFEDADALFRVWYDRITALSDARCAEYTVSRSYHVPNPPVASVTSDVTRTGVFVVSLADDLYTVLLIPSIRDELRTLDTTGGYSYLIDTGLADLDDFRTRITRLTDEYSVPVTGIVIAGIAT